MGIESIIASLQQEVAAARESLAFTNNALASLQKKKDAILAQPIHRDDIVAAFERGLDAAAADYENRLGWHLNDRLHATLSTEKLGEKAAQAVMLPTLKPSYDSFFPPSALGYAPEPLDPAAVIFFLSDAIRANLPALVDRLVPAAASGMRQAEREEKLAAIESEMVPLRAERDRLLRGIEAVQSTAAPPAAPKGDPAGLIWDQ